MENASLDDVRAFHRDYYGPNNAVLAIAGDVTPAQGFALARRYFGDIPARPTPPRPDYREGLNTREVRLQQSDALAQVQDPIDIAFCCLGTTRREAGSKEAFVHADYTLVVDTALTAKKLGAKHFLVVSAHGANAGSPFFYNQVKGKIANGCRLLMRLRLTIARPSMLMGHRDERRFNESIFAPLFRILPGNWKSIEARDVALAMLKEALAPSQEGVNIIPSAKLREIAQGEA
ncbi:MAG TPA: hypothetical protein DDZ62_00875 [Delftia acidovorans]|nr:hypothetical protein [Delftia acidovorans]